MGKFAIGSRTWPGLSKLVEECGEVLQVAGKIIATGGEPDHWDGTTLRQRLVDELGDLSAAIGFVVDQNLDDLDRHQVEIRRDQKRRLFEDWHQVPDSPAEGDQREEP
jgi:NTP pyrophosphatase (non-canonical NTP hydrolase)